MGNPEKYEVLQKFDFESKRLRSSIIVRTPENKIKIYLKGADNVILSHSNPDSQKYLSHLTKNHLDILAKSGLRTLGLSFRLIEQQEYDKWESNFIEIKNKSISDKKFITELENHITKIEQNNILLGCTALEDKLQESVTEDIKSFLNAGIKVWMLTGDKLDTAESIGYFCKLFNSDTEVFKIRSQNIEELKERLEQILKDMEILEADLEKFKNSKKSQSELFEIKNEKDLVVESPNSQKNIENDNVAPPVADSPRELSLIRKRRKSFEFKAGKQHKLDFIVEEEIRFKRKSQAIHKNHTFTLQIKNPHPIKKQTFRSAENLSENSIINYLMDKNIFDESINASVFKYEYNSNQVVKIEEQLNPASNIEMFNSNKTKTQEISSRRNDHKPTLNHLYDYYEGELGKLNEKKLFQIVESDEKKEKNDVALLSFGLIIEGISITLCLEPDVSDLFWRICSKSRSVVCARCNPSQKAEIVTFVKEVSNSTTLSIGDGGNDVNMIKVNWAYNIRRLILV